MRRLIPFLLLSISSSLFAYPIITPRSGFNIQLMGEYNTIEAARSACLSFSGSNFEPSTCINNGEGAYRDTRYVDPNTGSGYRNILTWKFSSSCPDGFNFNTEGSCSDFSQTACPDAGTIETGFKDINSDGVFTTINQSYSINGCRITVDSGDSAACYDDPSTTIAQCSRLIKYVHTGEKEGTGLTPLGTDDDPLSDPPEGDPLVGDNTTSTESTIDHDPTSQTMPDGTIVEQTSSTVTTVDNIGTNVSTKSDVISITQSEGITKVVTKLTTTTTHPDGSKTVTQSTKSSYSQSDMKYITVDKKTGKVSVVTNDGYAGKAAKTMTSTYDSNGKKTGESTSSTGSGSGEGNGQGEGEGDKDSTFCEKNPSHVDCKEYALPSSDGQYKPSDLTISKVVSDFKGRIKSGPIFSTAKSFFSLNLPSSSHSCPTWSVEVMGMSIVVNQFCDPLIIKILKYVVSAVLLATSSFYAFRIAFL